MRSAITAVQQGMVLFRAAKKFGVPYSTLKNQINKIKVGGHAKLGTSSHLTPTEEEEIKNWVVMCQQLGYPRTWSQVRIAAGFICSKNHAKTCKYYGKIPSFQWLKGFRSRFPKLKTRRSEKLAQASANVSEKDIRGWFASVTSWLKAKGQLDILNDPTRVFGGDETSFHLNRASKPVVALEGTSNVYDVQAGGSHENVTVLYTFCSDGWPLTPLIVFQGKMKPKNIWGDQVSLSVSERGWMTADLFTKWIREDFVPELTRHGTCFPIILFVDGHKSHVTLEVSYWCDCYLHSLKQ